MSSTPTPTATDLVLAQKEFLFPAVFHYFEQPMVIVRGKDQYVWDDQGKQYLDFFGGIVTISVGHCNDQVNAKLHQQLDTLQHVSTVFINEPQVRLAQKLAQLTPEGALTKSFFTNSGTEANETAILAARCYTGSEEVVALRHSYHGRSSLGMALTGISSWRAGGTLPAGVVHAHNAYCYRCPFGLTYPDCGVKCAEDVRNVIRTNTSGKIAALIAEPIQGVGGFITPPKEYFKIVASVVREHGGLFISDEVQTGWGRTGGKWFGIEQYGVVPDLITTAKGTANGLPIGVTIARPEVADALTRPITLSTFGGNPLSTTAASAVIDYIEEQDLLTNAEVVGAYLRERLLELQDRHLLIGDVRGMGLMQAIELVSDRSTKAPATREAKQLHEITRANGLLIGKAGLDANTFRLSPPLNIGRTDVDEAIRVLDRSLSQITMETA